MISNRLSPLIASASIQVSSLWSNCLNETMESLFLESISTYKLSISWRPWSIPFLIARSRLELRSLDEWGAEEERWILLVFLSESIAYKRCNCLRDPNEPSARWLSLLPFRRLGKHDRSISCPSIGDSISLLSSSSSVLLHQDTQLYRSSIIRRRLEAEKNNKERRQAGYIICSFQLVSINMSVQWSERHVVRQMIWPVVKIERRQEGGSEIDWALSLTQQWVIDGVANNCNFKRSTPQTSGDARIELSESSLNDDDDDGIQRRTNKSCMMSISLFSSNRFHLQFF